MIFKSGKEVKEIYLGSVPVWEIYIGSRLVWGGKAYMKGAAVIVLRSDALLRLADGITYSAEASGLPAAHASAEVVQSDMGRITAVGVASVIAEPYMRHVAPMTDSDVFSGGADVILFAVPSDAAKTASTALPASDANIYASLAEDIKISPQGGGIHEGNALAAEGAVIRLAHVSTPDEKADITGGSSALLRPINTGGGIHKSKGISAEGEITRTAEAYGAVYRAKGVPGSGEASGTRHSGGAVSAAAVDFADGNTDRIKVCSPLQSPMSEAVFTKAGSVLPECVYQVPAAVSEIKAGYANTNQVKASPVLLTGYSLAEPETAAGEEKGALCHAAFACAASMTVEPAPDNFDISDILLLDGLSVRDIDAMVI